MNVTPEMLVSTIIEHETGPLALAASLGWQHNPTKGFDTNYCLAINFLAGYINHQARHPTIPALHNGQPARFEVVYRDEDCEL